MSRKPFLINLLVLASLILTVFGVYRLGRMLLPPVSQGQPALSPLDMEPQTQNGITAELESYYADASRIIFQVRLTGLDGVPESINLLDENGDVINASIGYGPTGGAPSPYQFDFSTVSPLTVERLKGKLDFAVVTSPGEGEPLAHFTFDIDLPVLPALTFEPKQSLLSVSGVNMLLDRVVIAPSSTQVYLCYTKPNDDDWGIGSDTTLNIGGRQAGLVSYSLLSDADYSAGDKGGEPGWTPPVQDGRCVKISFPIGDAHPRSIRLTIPTLEQSMPEVIPEERLATAFRELEQWEGIVMEWHVVDHGAYPEYKKLPPGMSEQEAYRRFVGALGYIYNGQWEFNVQLDTQEQSTSAFTTSTYGMPTPIPPAATDPQAAAELAGRIHSFNLSPDGKFIAIATDQGLVLWDLNLKQLHRTLNRDENFHSAAWSPDGKYLAGDSLRMQSGEIVRPRVTVWDASTWEAVFERENDAEVVGSLGTLAWSPDGRALAFALPERGLLAVNIETGETVSEQKDFLQPPYDIDWSPDGSRMIATGDLGYGLRRWRVDTDASVRLYNPRAGAAAIQLAWSQDGKRIASGHADGTVCFWTVATNQCDGLIYAHQNQVSGLAWSPDGKRLATGSGVIRIWDSGTGRLLTSFGQQDIILYTHLEWLDAQTLVSLETGYADSAPTVIRAWNVATGSILFEIQGESGIFGE
jgi:Tol biopolymer transport system component